MKFPPFFSLCILTAVTLFSPLPRAGAEDAKSPPAAGPADRFAKWEKEIAAMEASDRTAPLPKCEILFIGSSTIRLWKSLAQDYPEHRVINRGFGGSQIVDATHFAPRLVFPHEPRVILLRSGGNDINAGKSPGFFGMIVAIPLTRKPRRVVANNFGAIFNAMISADNSSSATYCSSSMKITRAVSAACAATPTASSRAMRS